MAGKLLLLNALFFKEFGRSSRLAQSVEHETLNLGVVGSSPTLGATFLLKYFNFFLLKQK